MFARSFWLIALAALMSLEHAPVARSADAVNVVTPSVVIFAIPFWIAERNGYFKDENIAPTLDIVPNGREIDGAPAERHNAVFPGRSRRRADRRHQGRAAPHSRRCRAQAAALFDRQAVDQDLRRSARRKHRRAVADRGLKQAPDQDGQGRRAFGRRSEDQCGRRRAGAPGLAQGRQDRRRHAAAAAQPGSRSARLHQSRLGRQVRARLAVHHRQR